MIMRQSIGILALGTTIAACTLCISSCVPSRAPALQRHLSRIERYDAYLAATGQEKALNDFSPVVLQACARFRECKDSDFNERDLKRKAFRDAIELLNGGTGNIDMTTKPYRISEGTWRRLFGEPWQVIQGTETRHKILEYAGGGNDDIYSPSVSASVVIYDGFVMSVQVSEQT